MTSLAGRLLGHALRPFDHLAATMSWRGLRRFITTELASVPAGARVLNVGAGGRTAKVIEDVRRQRNFEVTSVDIDPNREPDIVADIIAFNPGHGFDRIVMIEVLEHVQQPFAAMENIHKLLNPGGKLIFSTPFLFPLHDEPMDFFRYTRHGLKLLCKAFERVEISRRDSWAENFCVLLARMFKERSTGAQFVAPVCVLLACLMYPIASLFSCLVKSESYTSGYTVSAVKSAE